jgi:hypothetical protein
LHNLIGLRGGKRAGEKHAAQTKDYDRN